MVVFYVSFNVDLDIILWTRLSDYHRYIIIYTIRARKRKKKGMLLYKINNIIRKIRSFDQTKPKLGH